MNTKVTITTANNIRTIFVRRKPYLRFKDLSQKRRTEFQFISNICDLYYRYIFNT